MTQRARSSFAPLFLGPALLLGACAPKATAPAPAEPDVAAPGPVELAEAPPEPAEPAEPVEPAEPLPATPKEPPAPLVWDKELERAQLPKSHGTIVLGASPCEGGTRQLILRREKAGTESSQMDLERAVGCELKREGAAWSTSLKNGDAVDPLHFRLGSVALDANTVAIVVAFVEEGEADPLVISRPEGLGEPGFGRLSDSFTDVVIAPPGELTRILRADGAHDFAWLAAFAVGVGADGELVEKPRDIWLARTKSFEDFREAAGAREALLGSCPKAAPRIALVEVAGEDGVSYRLGIPTLTQAEASTALRELKACGEAATVESRPAPKDD